MHDVLRHFRTAALRHDGGGLTDGQLLDCFLSRRDEAAFAALVRRHGPMVLGVCRRVLGNAHDAEDAFQATFLVLARKAAAVRSLGPWLHGVAYRTALRARTMNARRRAHEQRVREPARPDDGWQELLPLLDQELDRLPERYRVAVVLCDLEGRTRREAARQLGVPEGTLSGRLTRAHRLLARRLARYGLVPSAGVVAAALSEKAAWAGMTGALTAATAKAAVLGAGGEAGAVPARVVALTEGVVKTMLLSKLKVVVAAAVIVSVAAGVAGVAYRTGAAEPARAPAGAPPGLAVADDLEALRLEVEALRKSLQATRERVKTLESEVQTLKVTPRIQVPTGGGMLGASGGGFGGFSGMPLGGQTMPATGLGTSSSTLTGQSSLGQFSTSQPLQSALVRPADPLAEAEAALKKLRQDPNDPHAADALEKALKHLKERTKPGGGNKP